MPHTLNNLRNPGLASSCVNLFQIGFTADMSVVSLTAFLVVPTSLFKDSLLTGALAKKAVVSTIRHTTEGIST